MFSGDTKKEHWKETGRDTLPVTMNNFEKMKCIIMEKYALREKCPYSELFWSAFPHILTEYGPGQPWIRTLST